MSRLIFVVAMSLLLAAPMCAQTPLVYTAQWTEDAPTLAAAQAFQYALYLDSTKRVLVSTCTGTATPFACTASTGPIAAGTHTFGLTAADVTDPANPHESVQGATGTYGCSATGCVLAVPPPGVPLSLVIVFQ